ncbi:MAG: DUF2059 domain-containing protein [Caulobacter sp.]|nr:DUF2059 domain-containing protein [Caulobacter sp.]
MSRTVCALLCAAALLQPACAEASPEAPTSKALGCAQRYTDAMHMEETMVGLMKGLMPMMLEQERLRTGATVTAENQKFMTEAATESMAAMTPKMMDLLTPVLAASFTEAEVCALADFYGGDLGQSVIAKMPAYTGKSIEAMKDIIPLIQQDMSERYCRKAGCDAVQSPQPRPT